MLRYIFIIIFGGASVLVFIFAINPLYKDVQAVRKQTAELNQALNDSRSIESLRRTLIERSNTISALDAERIKKVLPDHVDNVRLILEINRIARDHGLSIQDVRVAGEGARSGSLGPDLSIYGTTGLDVTIAGSYRSFIDFLIDLERGLRIVDIRSLSFTGTPTDFNRYSLGLTTYWLR